jgi:hypothetical protein
MYVCKFTLLAEAYNQFSWVNCKHINPSNLTSEREYRSYNPFCELKAKREIRFAGISHNSVYAIFITVLWVPWSTRRLQPNIYSIRIDASGVVQLRGNISSLVRIIWWRGKSPIQINGTSTNIFSIKGTKRLGLMQVGCFHNNKHGSSATRH